MYLALQGNTTWGQCGQTNMCTYPPKITRVPNHMKYLNIEPHNVQAIVWWLAATLGCSAPKWPLMGVGAWGLQSVFSRCGKIPIFSDAALRPCMQNLKPLSLQLGKAQSMGGAETRQIGPHGQL